MNILEVDKAIWISVANYNLSAFHDPTHENHGCHDCKCLLLSVLSQKSSKNPRKSAKDGKHGFWSFVVKESLRVSTRVLFVT